MEKLASREMMIPPSHSTISPLNKMQQAGVLSNLKGKLYGNSRRSAQNGHSMVWMILYNPQAFILLLRWGKIPSGSGPTKENNFSLFKESVK